MFPLACLKRERKETINLIKETIKISAESVAMLIHIDCGYFPPVFLTQDKKEKKKRKKERRKNFSPANYHRPLNHGMFIP